MHPVKPYVPLVLSVLALVILLDFWIPGTEIEGEIGNKKVETQSHNNASSNAHHSYQIEVSGITADVSKEMYFQSSKGDMATIHRSPIFSEVGSVVISDKQTQETYSLRWYSGLVIPLLFLGFQLMRRATGNDFELLGFLLSLLLLADFVYLLL